MNISSLIHVQFSASTVESFNQVFIVLWAILPSQHLLAKETSFNFFTN